MAQRFCLGVAVVLGFFALANSLFMLASPEGWYHAIPGVSSEGPFNQHFVRDIGLAFMLVGLSFIAGARLPELRTGLWLVATFWLTGHAMFHLWEVAEGMKPSSTILRDFPAVSLPAIIGLGLTYWSWKSNRSLGGQTIGDAISRPISRRQPG